MKHIYQTIMAISLFSVTVTFCNAEDIQHVAPPVTQSKDAGMKHDMGGGMGMQHNMGGMGMQHGMGGMGMHRGMGGMMGMMAGMSEEEKEKHLSSMQEHLLKMHDLSNKILAEKDPAKQEQLKSEQRQLMKAHHEGMMEHRRAMQAAPAAPATSAVPAAK